MSLTDEGKTSPNNQTASENLERAQSGTNGTMKGLPGLAGFGQTLGYAPVTEQPQAPLAAEEAAAEETGTAAASHYPDEPQYAETFEEPAFPVEPAFRVEPAFPEAPVEPEFTEALAVPEFTETRAAPVEQFAPAEHPETEIPVNPLGEINPQAQGFLNDQEAQFDNPPGFLAAGSVEPVLSSDPLAEEPFVSDSLQSFMNEPHPEVTGTAAHAVAGGFDSGVGINPETARPVETGNALKTFEAYYDEHPEIPLGAFDEPVEGQGEQPFFHEQEQGGDAQFLSGEPGTEYAKPKEHKGRKVLMAASGLIGVMALGGALAFAYKIGGDSDIASTGKPPLIQADNSPVKVAPAKPGGKQFPHKNKKIYERLQGENSQVAERLVPRQESVAAAATAALGTAQTAAANTVSRTAPVPMATAPAGAPRRVKTLTVRPDGTIEPATPRRKGVKAPPAAPENSGAGIAMSFPQPASAPAAPPAPVAAPPQPARAQSAPLQTAALPRVAASAPPPVQKPRVPAPRRVAALPASAPAADNRSYVVQVAARKSQGDALAAFADIQQKYPSLLSGYRPIIKKADLGGKGVWYRLNVGPVKNKKVASNLCGSLKSAGMRSCIIRAQ